MQGGRKQKVAKNIIAQSLYSGVQVVLSFFSRKIFVVYLSAELLGLNGLLTSMLGMLSIAELGVGEAINFSLYKPLAQGDNEQVKSIMKLYKKLYIIIGIVIAVLGIALMPVLQFFDEIKAVGSLGYVYKIYLLFLLDTFLSYCLAYSRNIISADQRDYIVTNADLIGQIAVTIFQTVALILTKNYILYLVIKTAVTVVRNGYLYKKSFLLFPYLKEKNIKPLTAEYKHNLFENVKALFVTKVAYYCVSGTDNILLTSFVSLTSVAIYTNYVTILGIINKAFNTVFDKARASIGNYLETENSHQIYALFKQSFFINFILTSYTSICVFILCNEVITVWLGKKFVWPLTIVGLLVFNNYSRFILQSCEAFRGAAGLYSPKPFVKYISLMEGIINLVVSLFFIIVFKLGVFGVFLGTAVSTLVSTLAVPWIVYKFLFKKSLMEYFILYMKYLFVGLGALVLSYMMFQLSYTESHLLNIFIGGLEITIVTGGVYILFFSRMEEYKYCLRILKKVICKIVQR